METVHNLSREDRTWDHISLAKQGQCAAVYGVGISSFGTRIRVIIVFFPVSLADIRQL